MTTDLSASSDAKGVVASTSRVQDTAEDDVDMEPSDAQGVAADEAQQLSGQPPTSAIEQNVGLRQRLPSRTSLANTIEPNVLLHSRV